MHIRKSLLQFIFTGAYMKRWNDKLRPLEFLEADKQCHKMIIAWLLCRLNSNGLSRQACLDLELRVIEEGIYDYLFRLVLTDIKPPVFYRIKRNPEHYRRLTEWALGELEPVLGGLGGEYAAGLAAWARRSPDGLEQDLAARILEAAHTCASGWELGLLRGMNDFDPELPDIVADFRGKLSGRADLRGLSEISGEKSGALGDFARLCGQLRFQKRWSRAPRIPETSVMGHMFFVACYAYFFSLAAGACPARRVNNFFCALFHDLPELLTRDIISPVKKSVPELDAIIRAYEEEELRRRIFEPLRKEGLTEPVERLGYYLGLELGSEFCEGIRRAGRVERVNGFATLHADYNKDEYDPRDGELLKACDNLAAFIEAHTAIRNGINAGELHDAAWRIRNNLSKVKLGAVHLGAILADFD